LNPACAQSQIHPTLGAQGRGQRRATLRRVGKRAPPVVAHRHTIHPSYAEPSSHFAVAQIHARLTNPAKQNIITSIRGSRRPVADFKSEPRPASNRNQWPASYWNAWPASSVSARGADRVIGLLRNRDADHARSAPSSRRPSWRALASRPRRRSFWRPQRLAAFCARRADRGPDRATRAQATASRIACRP
jgi:hypothetical protein